MPTSRPRTPAPSSANCRRTQRCACARHLRKCVVGPKADRQFLGYLNNYLGRAERLLSGTDGQKWSWDAHGPVGTRCLVLSGIEKKYDLPYSAPNGPERERLGVGRLRGSTGTARPAREIGPSRANDMPWRPPLITRSTPLGPHAYARPDRSRRRPCASAPARMQAEKRPPDDTAGAPTCALDSAPIDALSGGGDAVVARRPAAHLPIVHAKQLRQRAPGRGPRATQISPLQCRPQYGRRIGAPD